MAEPKSTAQLDDEDEYHDALDDFTFYDCIETFPQSNGDVSILDQNPNSSPPGLRRRRSKSHHKSTDGDSSDSPHLSSPVNLDNYSRERKSNRKNKEKLIINDEKSEDHSTITNVNANDNTFEDETNSSFLITLADVLIKSISFQVSLLVKIFMFPIWLAYYMYMFVFDPFGLMKRCREYLFQKIRTIWNVSYEFVSQFMYEWLKEQRSVWKLGLKCCWGLLWSSYVCAVLVGLLLSAFVVGGILIRVVVEEPIRMKRSLNFDFKEKSPVAFVPIVTSPELIHDVYFGEKPETAKYSGSRFVPLDHKLKVTVLLTLPESEYNQNLGIFQVRVDFLAADGKVLAMSRRPCMLQFKSQPIRLLLTFLKATPILTGYTSETQNLKVNFRGFTEGEKPTACLRVVIEQRAEYSPGAGIPEIYSAYLTLESELPLLKKFLWFWKKTLFVWLSMVIFTTELFFAVLCCRPVVFPKIRLRGAGNTNRDFSQNDRRDRS